MITMMSNAFTSPYKLSSVVTLDSGKWLLLYDKKNSRALKKIKGDFVPLSLKGGESAKSFEAFESLLSKICNLESKHGNFVGFCVLGGGSLGDLGAFTASIYKRGVRLVHVPTTYLSVVDSAFGGKTALNFGGAKNQVGSFYPAEKVFLVKSFLPNNKNLLVDSFAEIMKMALLERGLWNKLSRCPQAIAKNFWKLAIPCIEAKLKIVKRDPFEKRGIRQLLNLGHTLGHLFEKLAPLTHGEAIALGLSFELEFFLYKGKIRSDDYLEILEVWERYFNYAVLRKKLGQHSLKKAEVLLRKDKKLSSRNFVVTPVVSKIGRVRVEKVELLALLSFLKAQGVLK